MDVTVETFSNRAWLAHELERRYRTLRGAERFSDGVTIHEEPGRRRFDLVTSATLHPNTSRHVAWLSADNTIVQVDFSAEGVGRSTDAVNDIVDAYLALYPSSLPDTIVDTPEHHTQWVRDEMSRLLEYAGRDLGFARAAQQPHKQSGWLEDATRELQQFATFQEAFYAAGSGAQFRYEVEHDNVTADGTSRDDVKLQKWLEQRQHDFSAWWSAHQTAPVLLRTPGAPPRATATLRLPPAVAATMRALLGTPAAPAVTPSVAP